MDNIVPGMILQTSTNFYITKESKLSCDYDHAYFDMNTDMVVKDVNLDHIVVEGFSANAEKEVLVNVNNEDIDRYLREKPVRKEFISLRDNNESVIRDHIEKILTTDITIRGIKQKPQLKFDEILMGFGYTIRPDKEVNKRLSDIIHAMVSEGLLILIQMPSITRPNMIVNHYMWEFDRLTHHDITNKERVGKEEVDEGYTLVDIMNKERLDKTTNKEREVKEEVDEGHALGPWTSSDAPIEEPKTCDFCNSMHLYYLNSAICSTKSFLFCEKCQDFAESEIRCLDLKTILG